jgi:prophage antirepressor-like protein
MAMQTFAHNNNTFVLLDDIKKNKVNEEYFVGCKSARKCVERHSIPEDKCLYMKNNKLYSKSYKTAEVFVEAEYANANIIDKVAFHKKKDAINVQKKKEQVEHLTHERENRKNYDESETTEAPPVLILEDHEMFQDENGAPMDIEMRGEKTMNGAYFKACDLGKAFAYKLIQDIILHPNSDHKYERHYMYFNIKSTLSYSGFQNDGNVQNGMKKELYLTYNGLLKLLFCARGNKAERFQEWATRILFTMQMGGQGDKDALAAEALNVDVSTITQIFRKSAKAVPCVYLFEVGTVGNMRQHFNLENHLDSDAKVYKYGMSSDMARRASEHSKTYGKLKDNSFGLNVFSYIDVLFMSNAETQLKHSFENMSVRLDDPKHNELVVIKKEQLPFIKELFTTMHICYSGNNTDLIRQMQEMQLNHQMKIREFETARLIQNKDHEHELEKKNGEIGLIKKDMEFNIMKHKNELQEVELNYLRKMVK